MQVFLNNKKGPPKKRDPSRYQIYLFAKELELFVWILKTELCVLYTIFSEKQIKWPDKELSGHPEYFLAYADTKILRICYPMKTNRILAY